MSFAGAGRLEVTANTVPITESLALIMCPPEGF
jgi:hypothetical protein